MFAAGAIMGALGMVIAGIDADLLCAAGVAGHCRCVYGAAGTIPLRLVVGTEPAGSRRGRLWRLVEPFGRRLLPVPHTSTGTCGRARMGWIPCGLVYSMLVNASPPVPALKGQRSDARLCLGNVSNSDDGWSAGGAAARLAQFSRAAQSGRCSGDSVRCSNIMAGGLMSEAHRLIVGARGWNHDG